MADRKKATAGSGDTDFRKTWDRAEYAAKAADHESKQKDESRARYEAKLAGKKYHRRASTPPDARDTIARSSRLDISDQVGKTMLVPAGAALGKRGRGAGFYCEHCDLTFKDNLQMVDHLNSKQHLMATGETGEVKIATKIEVRYRLLFLKRIKEEEKAAMNIDLKARLDIAREREEKEREERRQKRNEQRRKTKGGTGIKQEVVEGDGIIR